LHYWVYLVVVGNVLEWSVLTKQLKKKIDYRQGSEAKEAFEKTMKVLFQVPKSISKKPKKGKD